MTSLDCTQPRTPENAGPVSGIDQEQFERIRRLVFDVSGIHLRPGKESLVRSRLARRLRRLGMTGFDQYLEAVERGGMSGELSTMIDVLTTNKTSFFREPQHFNFLRAHVIPQRRMGGRCSLRIWSAGCSSGEEPYSLAVTLREAIPDLARWDCRILATDISSQVLAKAREGVYREEALKDVPPEILRRYFTTDGGGPPGVYRVCAAVRALVRVARLNLLDPWPMTGPFDAIFCRNVMIYFERSIQIALTRRFWKMLEPGGYLFLGHSESLTGSHPGFRFVEPSIYVR